MPRSTPQQDNFLGGEWNPLSQGRADLPGYHTALDACQNFIPIEEGSLSRRSAIEFMGPTYLRGKAKFLSFISDAANPFLLELTSDKLRLWYGTGPVCTNDRQVLTASSSSGGVLSLTTTTSHGWSVGDHIIIFCPSTLAASDIAVVKNRHLQLTAASGTSLTAKDDKGNALPGDIASGGLNGATAIRIKRFDTTGITAALLPTTRIVQAQTQALLLSGALPLTLKVTTDLSLATSDADPVLSLTDTVFTDGPYLNPQPDTGTVNAYAGSITFTPASSTFSASDVGRYIRLFSQPAAWASGTTYTAGEFVTDAAGAWWVFNYSSGLAGVIPGSLTTVGGVQIMPWSPAPTAGQWAWGTITAQATTSCTVTLATDLNSANGTTIASWRLGIYKTGAYPTVGVFYGGRIWLAGAAKNRVDASQPFDPSQDSSISMSPTDAFGNVNDDNAFSYTLLSNNLYTIYWMKPDREGLLLGTSGGEILLEALSGGAITPTNIQEHTVETNLQSANVEAIRPGIAIVFVQRYLQRVIEILADAFTGRYSGSHVNEYAKHITAAGVKELAYQEEKAPVIWTLDQNGNLAGCTYRRISRFTTEPPKFMGWHRHPVGDGSTTINSMCAVPGTDGLGDRLYVNTVDLNGDYWVETMRPLFEDA